MFGGSGAWWIIILFLFLFGTGGFGFGGTNNGALSLAEEQRSLVINDITDKLDGLTNNVYQSTFALNNSILSEGRNLQTQFANCCCETNRNIDAVRFDMANYVANINANTNAGFQKILDKMCEDKIQTMQSQINQLQLNSALCGVVRYPMATTYNSGCNPYCTGCGC